MAIDVTYSFSPLTTILSAEVNQNFQDLRDSIRAAHHQDVDGTKIVNADVDAAAAIAYSKLNLATSIVDGDVNASAAISWSKISKSGSVLGDLGDTSLGSAAGGDIIYRNGSSQWVRLAKGSDGEYLKLASGLPSWGAGSSGQRDSASSTAVQSTTSTSFVDGTGMTITFTVSQSSRVLLIFHASWYADTNGITGAITFNVAGTDVESGADLINQTFEHPDEANKEQPVAIQYLTPSLSAGSTTFKVRFRNASGSATLNWKKRYFTAIELPA